MMNFFLVLKDYISEYFYYLVDLLRGLGDGLLVELFSACETFLPGDIDWSSVQSTIDQANWFFPVSETLTLAISYGGLWGLVFCYRLIKSWIPTVSGT